MAVITHGSSFGKPTVRAVLLSGEVATATGSWTNVEGFTILVFETRGIDGASGGTTVQIRGSNATGAAPGATGGVQLGSDITACGMTTLATPIRYVKAMVTVYASGNTVGVRMFGRDNV